MKSLRWYPEAASNDNDDTGPTPECSYVCEYCGGMTEYLVEVDDSDPSVGYFDTLNVCRDCAESDGRRDGR